MRIVPVPMRYLELFPKNVRQLADLAEESSCPAHCSAKCLACNDDVAIHCSFLEDSRLLEEPSFIRWRFGGCDGRERAGCNTDFVVDTWHPEGELECFRERPTTQANAADGSGKSAAVRSGKSAAPKKERDRA